MVERKREGAFSGVVARAAGQLARGMLLATALACVTGASARAQDAAAGEKDFVVCRVCHQIGPTAKNSVGPSLNGVVGRKAGTYPGYNYSAPNKNSNLTWSDETLVPYLENPQKVVKGTKMTFPGLKDPQKVKDVIAFLKQFQPDGTKKETQQ